MKFLRITVVVAICFSFLLSSGLAAAKKKADLFSIVAIAGSEEVDPGEIIKKKLYINMYEMHTVNETQEAHQAVGKLVKTVTTGIKGQPAYFDVKPGQAVTFAAFATKKEALKAKKYTPDENGTDTVSALRNFLLEDGVSGRLCFGTGKDYLEKSMDDGEPNCRSNKEGYMTGRTTYIKHMFSQD